ncbi:uncharacterized protein METZ01_LOCUS209412, partial [marine metagenome]
MLHKPVVKRDDRAQVPGKMDRPGFDFNRAFLAVGRKPGNK